MIEIICQEISYEVLKQIDRFDDNDLIIKLLMQLKRFDLLIKWLENNKEKQEAYLLLITHVGDMLYLIQQERPEILDKYRIVKNKE